MTNRMSKALGIGYRPEADRRGFLLVVDTFSVWTRGSIVGLLDLPFKKSENMKARYFPGF